MDGVTEIMKKFAIALAALLICSPAFAGTIKLSSTIGPVDAGIIPLLAETYKAKTGTDFVIEKAGTGATLNKAKSGNFDMVVVHARALEEQFIAEGYGQNRRDFMYNDFIILGPQEDPAGIKGMKSAAEALKKIAAAKAPFISRGDMSGTHVAEMNVWKAAGIAPDGEKDEWYTVFSLGKLGNGPSHRLHQPARRLHYHGQGHLPHKEEGAQDNPARRGRPDPAQLHRSDRSEPETLPAGE